MIERDSNGRFLKGNAGGGRFRSAINKDAFSILEVNAVGLANKAVELALEGDTAMIKLCIDKLMPTATIVQTQIIEQLNQLEDDRVINN